MKYSLIHGLLAGSITLNILAAGFYVFSDTQNSNHATALPTTALVNNTYASEPSSNTHERSAIGAKTNSTTSIHRSSANIHDEDASVDNAASSDNPYLAQSESTHAESSLTDGDLQPSALSQQQFEQLIKDNPKAVTAIKQEQRMRTHIEYQGFFNQYAMDSETKQHVLQALTERNLADFEVNPSDEESMARAYEQHQQYIAELLGPELSQKLDTYEKIQESRWTLMDVKQQLSSHNQTFDLQKERQLAHIISETKDQALNELDSSGAWDSDQGYAEAYQQHMKSAHEIILEKARYDLKLTQEELLALKRSLEYERLQSLTTDLITNTLFSE